MARVERVNPGDVSDEYTAKVLKAQAKMWGAPLLNHVIYARRPSILRGAREAWTGIDGSGVPDDWTLAQAIAGWLAPGSAR